MSVGKEFEVEREHSRYENALEDIEQLAQDGIEMFDVDSKNEALRRIRDLAEEVR
ncbi:hypothetical protein HUG10_21050 (plasmid) [Halorarum halophilum]|uniref:Uncharacterized protein n=1 Tax=Halorarum halophilum TaxID=2743090 RepID=A0A7D5KIJ7_9EURY|nr:hypothetical protein [Halobaculum halophilum]QLG30076.1 hypothetical protein HUG10_21050 [Halobaculum halophilum]